MERVINLRIERLPEGVYLATSEDVRGLVVHAASVADVLALVPDLVNDLDEVAVKYGFGQKSGRPVPASMEFPFVLAA